MSRLRLISYALLFAAFSPHHAAAQYQNPQNPIGSIIGGLLRNAAISQAQNAWNAYDQAIVGCINSSGTINVPALVNQGILPTDPRLSPLIQQCQNEIAAQEAQAQQQQQQAAEQQQQAEAASQQAAQAQAQVQAAQQQAAALAAQQQAQAQAAQQQADALAAQQQAQAQAEQQAQAAADAKLMAEEQATAAQVTTLFLAFQNKEVDPNDHTASLLNYTSFGSDSGSSDAFWVRQNASSTTYAEYQKGVTVQEPEEELQEIDVSKIDPSKLYIQEQSGSPTVLFGSTVFAICQSCSMQSLKSRWIGFFQAQTK
jgi:flagellar biosynthesis GTPase FlhF